MVTIEIFNWNQIISNSMYYSGSGYNTKTRYSWRGTNWYRYVYLREKSNFHENYKAKYYFVYWCINSNVKNHLVCFIIFQCDLGLKLKAWIDKNKIKQLQKYASFVNFSALHLVHLLIFEYFNLFNRHAQHVFYVNAFQFLTKHTEMINFSLSMMKLRR